MLSRPTNNDILSKSGKEKQMALWDKGANRPKHFTSTQKRNVIATNAGWVRRSVYTDKHSNLRIKDETIVAIGNLAGDTSQGNPDIVEIYVANSTGGTALKRLDVSKVYVVYDEPISIGASATAYTISVANTASGVSGISASSNTNKASITNANNTLVFQFVANSSSAGTYKIQAQNLANTAQAKVYSIIGGASETVNTTISAVVSNTLSTFSIT